jgi:uncharacterized Tic20 family protein
MAILKYVRVGYLLGWLIAWNAILGAGMWLDKQNPEGPAFGASCAIASLLTSAFCLSVLFVPTVQSAAIRPASNVVSLRNELWLVCILTSALGLAAFIGVVIG